MEAHTYNGWLVHSFPSQARPVDIKVEPALESSVFPLFSPPSSPQRSPTESAAFSSSRRRSNTSIANSKRVKPYPILTRELHLSGGDIDTMANTWSPPGSKGGSARAHFPVEQASQNRRTSDGDPQVSSYGPFATQSFGGRSSGRSRAPSSTSSLIGAMGDTHLSSHSEDSDSPSPTDGRAFNMQGVAWTSNQHPTSSSHTHFGGIPEQSGNSGNMPYHGLSSTSTGAPSTVPYLQYQNYSQSAYVNPASQSMSPRSSAYPASTYSDQQPFALSAARPSTSMQQRSATPSAHSESPGRQRTSRTAQEQYEDEIRHLRKKVRELELINESARLRQKDLEMELANNHHVPSQGFSSSNHGLPSPILTPSPQSPTFQASWKARTDARIRQFCSLNRAGNALCAWHDSRRERRAYPPRMAPAGHLNCGCTYDEALFEESLSRHGVGSYHPGESVRMDPALRNPLLKLLQARYGYRDGDFERDVATGHWVEGEGHAVWEHKAIAGASNTRKSRGDDSQ